MMVEDVLSGLDSASLAYRYGYKWVCLGFIRAPLLALLQGKITLYTDYIDLLILDRI
jgi:hypothetical protein